MTPKSSRGTATTSTSYDGRGAQKADATRSSGSDRQLNNHDRLASEDSTTGNTVQQAETDTGRKLSIKDATNASLEKSLTPSNTSSPKLGVKMLGTHISKTASNVAVVQPRSGEKMETTFDAEVRTETVHKHSPDLDMSKTALGKETTFLTPDKDEKTTFMDDAGETMDIKPMPPIMRALPYGYFRGYSGYGGFSNRNFHIPG
ncbi:unnamed protein product, partial [Candidula unifasciata]